MLDYVPTRPGEDDPEARDRTVNNLKFIAWGMHNFAKKNDGRLPAAAIGERHTPLLSWRVAILPYLEQSRLHEKFHLDEPWDGPYNASLLEEMPQVYAPVTGQESGSQKCL